MRSGTRTLSVIPSSDVALFHVASVWLMLAVLPAALAPRLGGEIARLVAFVAAALFVLWVAAPAQRRGSTRSLWGAVVGAMVTAVATTVGLVAYCTLSTANRGLVAAPARWLAAVLVAPVFEEILYRDHVLGAFRVAVGPTGAVLLGSALFAISHLEPWTTAASFVAGSWLGWLRLRTGSLAACIGIHAAFNAAALATGSRGSRAAALVLTFLGTAAPSPAAELAWSGTFSVEFLAPGLAPIAIPGSGVATVNASGGPFPLQTLRLARGITGTVSVPVSDPDVVGTIPAVRVTASLGSGTLGPFWPTAAPGQAQLTRNTLPVHGAARLCLLSLDCAVGIPLPFSTTAGLSGVGVGGSWTVGLTGSQWISIQASPWTLQTATVTVATTGGGSFGVPASGWLHGPFSFASSAALTGGSIALVTPMSFAISNGQTVPAFGRLTLRFVPEPAGPVMAVAGIACLAGLVGRRLRTHQRPAEE